MFEHSKKIVSTCGSAKLEAAYRALEATVGLDVDSDDLKKYHKTKIEEISASRGRWSRWH